MNWQTEEGLEVPVIPKDTWLQIVRLISERAALDDLQIAELGALGLSMVSRSALGLSAEDAQIACIASDCLAGCIVLAAARQLVNAGAMPVILLRGKLDLVEGSVFHRLLQNLQHLEVPLVAWSEVGQREEVERLLEQSHAILCGVYNPEEVSADRELVELVNELATPVHAVMLPPSSKMKGEKGSDSIFASSTLSLGLPLDETISMKDHLGRHYLVDISLAANLLSELGVESKPWFRSQPVLQIVESATENLQQP